MDIDEFVIASGPAPRPKGKSPGLPGRSNSNSPEMPEMVEHLSSPEYVVEWIEDERMVKSHSSKGMQREFLAKILGESR